MTIGCDIDGVITLFSRKIRKTLPWWLFALLIFVPPFKKIINILKKMGLKNKIILISARPKKVEFLTKLYLKWFEIPYEKIYLLGPGKDIEKRKLEIILQEKIDIFIDDEQEILEFLIKQGINAVSPKGVLLYF